MGDFLGPAARTSTLIAVRHAMVAEGLAAVLRRAGDIDVVDPVCWTGDRAVAVLGNRPVAVLVVDEHLPDVDGLEVVRAAAEVAPGARTLLLHEGADDGPLVLAAVRAGCDGVLAKDRTGEALVAAVRTVAGGGTVFDPAALVRFASRAGLPRQSHGERLTAREREILQLLAGGMAAVQIASDLALHPLTVRNHVQNIMGKLSVHSRLEAVTLALQLGLVRPPDPRVPPIS